MAVNSDEVFDDEEDPLAGLNINDNFLRMQEKTEDFADGKEEENVEEVTETEEDIPSDIVDRIEDSEAAVEERNESEDISDEENTEEDDSDGDDYKNYFEQQRSNVISEDYIGEEDDDENDKLLDVNEEYLKYSSSNQGISYEDFQQDNEDEFDEINGFNEDNINSEKKTFQEINDKNSYKSGKFNKSVLLAAVIFIVVALFGYVSILSYHKKNQEDKLVNGEKDVKVNGYNPDFGDYKNRRNKKEDEGSVEGNDEQEALNKLLEAEEKVYGKKYDDANPVVYYNANPQPQQNYSSNSAPATTSSGPSPREKANESPLRLGGTGFGYQSGGGATLYGENGGESNGNINDMLSSFANPENYFKQLNDVRNGLSLPNQQNNAVGKPDIRSSSQGMYEPGNTGGDVYRIPEYSLYPGTVLHAVLINGINTDYPGMITARIINPVYDSRTGKQLLIPAGSILRGSYSSASIGVKRVQIAWTTLIMNRDGADYVVELGTMVGIDKSGYSGIRGTLNDHAFQYVRAMGMAALFTYINSNIYEVTNAQKSKTVQEMISDSQEIANDLTDKLLDRALNIEPTIKVRPGTRISVDVDKVLTIPPYKNDPTLKRYIRK